MTSFFARVDEVRRRWDVLRHPFYERWVRGELAPSELAFYAGQYRHAVVALADSAAHAGDARHAEEERSHVALATLYAIEAAQPAISETKLAGLTKHYGASAGSDATRYFDVHAVLDHAHAAHNRQQLVAVMQSADEDRLLAEIELVLQANWQLLDGCGCALSTNG